MTLDPTVENYNLLVQNVKEAKEAGKPFFNLFGSAIDVTYAEYVIEQWAPRIHYIKKSENEQEPD